MIRIYMLAVAAATATAVIVAAQTPGPADLVLVNGRVFTRGRADAMGRSGRAPR